MKTLITTSRSASPAQPSSPSSLTQISSSSPIRNTTTVVIVTPKSTPLLSSTTLSSIISTPTAAETTTKQCNTTNVVAVLENSAINRNLSNYWHFYVVTLVSIYAILVVPYVAPFAVLVQYQLLRLIRQRVNSRIRQNELNSDESDHDLEANHRRSKKSQSQANSNSSSFPTPNETTKVDLSTNYLSVPSTEPLPLLQNQKSVSTVVTSSPIFHSSPSKMKIVRRLSDDPESESENETGDYRLDHFPAIIERSQSSKDGIPPIYCSPVSSSVYDSRMRSNSLTSSQSSPSLNFTAPHLIPSLKSSQSDIGLLQTVVCDEDDDVNEHSSLLNSHGTHGSFPGKVSHM
jgi:hypothetical protein